MEYRLIALRKPLPTRSDACTWTEADTLPEFRSLSPGNIQRKTSLSSLQRAQTPLTGSCCLVRPQRSKNSSVSRTSALAISCVPRNDLDDSVISLRFGPPTQAVAY